MNAQETSNVIKLVAPDKSGGQPTMKAFAKRHSVREFAPEALKAKDHSTLLWATDGINRPSSGMRTAPSAMNKQDVDVYVVLPQGAYLYNAKEHALHLIAKGDYRADVAGAQEAVKTAPLFLVYVSDPSRFGTHVPAEAGRTMGCIDIGIVVENACLACSSLGLSVVPRATMNQTQLKQVLKLKDTEILGMNTPVGYPKK
ncbi:MAG: SagB/ThcOx family dehydrogenase [Tannerella sp.]|nr:SagB/ThcOx family dehydrogenase [Tannerella sp.]